MEVLALVDGGWDVAGNNTAGSWAAGLCFVEEAILMTSLESSILQSILEMLEGFWPVVAEMGVDGERWEKWEWKKMVDILLLIA